ncbi:hypothetical protein GCM10007972_19350 [Iodidimonas muriae]|uniref:Uncharacterized protein n=1 Tax=Iodidimonas muriae TaxID=261467 RepID=A0ABQ2LE72_9PROT|nr:hypothetical protein [Iodidimonas muriae]GER07028.1 hypothetical protein JCM17843_13380 [Kordiimonadales bacterium JCM 17843]GGO13280.1 hypothetical protein GCM10007972_19350 [Iodidimonas muriae]
MTNFTDECGIARLAALKLAADRPHSAQDAMKQLKGWLGVYVRDGETLATAVEHHFKSAG